MAKTQAAKSQLYDFGQVGKRECGRGGGRALPLWHFFTTQMRRTSNITAVVQ